MRVRSTVVDFLCCVLFVILLPVLSLGQTDNTSFFPAVNYLLKGNNLVVLNPEKIGGLGSIIIYQGEEHDDPVVVPKNCIVGVIVDGQPRLYHPAMGEGIAFSDKTDKLAFACFWLSLQGSDLNTAFSKKNSKFPTLPAQTDKSITAGNSLPNGMRTGLPPRVLISRDDPKITITNTLQRWVAVKVHAAATTRVYFLSPYGRQISSNIIVTLGNQGLIPSDYFKGTGSSNSITISSSDVTRIDVFGAIFRSFPVMVTEGKWPPGTTESWEGYRSDRELVLKLNVLDTMHFMLEGVEHLLGIVPLECFDTGVSAITNQIEFLFLQYVTEEQRVSSPYLLAWRNEFATGLALCLGELGVAPLELLNTFVDLAGALDFLVEDIGFAFPQMAYSNSFWVIDNVPQPAGTCDVSPQTIIQKGHTWQRCAPLEIPDVLFGSFIVNFSLGQGFIFTEAEQYCQNLKLAGHSDWRLPTKDELKDLVYCSNGKPTPLKDNESCRWPEGPSWDSVLYYTPTWYPGASPSWSREPPDDIPIYTPNYTDFTGAMSYYWTSTEYSKTEMWTVNFEYGSATSRTKNHTEKVGSGTHYINGRPALVRCIR